MFYTSHALYNSSFIQLMFYTTHILDNSCFIQLMFYTTHVWHNSCFIQLVFYTTHVWYNSCLMQLMFYTTHVLYKTHVSNTIHHNKSEHGLECESRCSISPNGSQGRISVFGKLRLFPLAVCALRPMLGMNLPRAPSSRMGLNAQQSFDQHRE